MPDIISPTVVKEVAKQVVEKLEQRRIEKSSKALEGEPVEIGALPLVSFPGISLELLVENAAISKEYAGLFHGAKTSFETLPGEADALGIRINIADHYMDISFAEDSLLGALRLNDAVASAFDPLIRQLEELRFGEIVAARNERQKLSIHPVLNDLGLIAPVKIPLDMMPWESIANIEQEALRVLDENGVLLVAKRVDYLFGEQYVKGELVDFPIVGGLTNLFAKVQLGAEVGGGDVVQLASDSFLILTLAAAPFTGGASTIAGVAARGAIISASHYGLINGVSVYLETGNIKEAIQVAGEKAAIGAVTGAAGGAISGKIVQVMAPKMGPVAGDVVSGGIVGGGMEAKNIILASDTCSMKEAFRRIGMSAGRGLVEDAVGTSAIRGVTSRLGGISPSVIDPKVAVVEGRMSGLDGNERIGRALEFAKQGPYLSGKEAIMGEKLSSYVKNLDGVSGVETNLKYIGGRQIDSARGRFTELGAANALKNAGYDIAAIGKHVDIPGLGKTDIDVLTHDGLWLEKKHVQNISCDKAFREKIDKMAAGMGKEVMVDGEVITIQRVAFTNSKQISAPALEYAARKGVEIYGYQPYTRPLPR